MTGLGNEEGMLPRSLRCVARRAGMRRGRESRATPVGMTGIETRGADGWGCGKEDGERAGADEDGTGRSGGAGFWGAVYATDCAAGARAAGVQRDIAMHYGDGRDSEAGTGGDYFVGWAEFCVRQRCAEMRSGGAGDGNPGAGDLLRDAVDCEESGRNSGTGGTAGVRTGATGPGAGGERNPGEFSADDADLGESRGQRAGAAARVSFDGEDGQCVCSNGRSEAQDLCGAVPSGSESHGTRHGDIEEFPVQGVQGRAEVERSGVYRGVGGGNTAEGGSAPGDLWVERGSGFDGGGGVGAPSDGRPVDEHLREYGAAAEERV